MANLLLARSGKQQGGFHKREGEREREREGISESGEN